MPGLLGQRNWEILVKGYKVLTKKMNKFWSLMLLGSEPDAEQNDLDITPGLNVLTCEGWGMGGDVQSFSTSLPTLERIPHF